MDEFITKQIFNYYNLKFLEKYLEGHNGFIAGGCFKNIFNKEKIKDIDIFFETEDDYLDAVNYYSDNDEFLRYYIYYQNEKVTAFKEHANPDITIELIKSVFGTPEDVINTFDFSITKFALYYAETDGDPALQIIHHKDFFEHLYMKRLVCNSNILYPVSTLDRMFKYAKYGYFPCKETKENLIINLVEKADLSQLSQSLYWGLD